VAISTPGHERRIEESPVTDWRALVRQIGEALINCGLVDDVPYAFFGHSFGSILAFEVAQLLDETLVQHQPRPVHLFVSAHCAPAAVSKASRMVGSSPVHTLDDEELLISLQKFGFLPSQVVTDAALGRAILPALKADLQMYEAYMPEQSRKALPLCITALGGSGDVSVPAMELQLWSQETSQEFFGPKMYDGGHFFVEDFLKDVVDLALRSIEHALSELPRSIFSSNLQIPEACNQLVQDVILRQSNIFTEMTAIVDERGRMTYADMAAQVEHLALKLHSECLKGQSSRIVGLLLPKESTYIVSMLAIWKAGAILLVLESHFPADMVAEICNDTAMPVAIVNQAHASKFDGTGCQTLVLDGNWATDNEHEGPSAELPICKPSDIAILCFTSGTTGKPKTISGSNFFMHLGYCGKNQLIPYCKDDSREAFNVMFVFEALRPLMHGLTSFCLPDEAALDPTMFVSCLQKHRCSRVLTTPSLLSNIMSYAANNLRQRLDLMRTWITCGEVLPMQTVDRFRELLPQCRLVNDYSTWETGDVAYAVVHPQPSFESSKLFAAAGMLAPGVTAIIVDPETKVVVPIGVTGELYVAGKGLSDGYFSSPDATAQKFVPGFNEEMQAARQDKWYKTGDAGRFVGEPPVLEIRGRIDSTVKIRGFKVGLPVVESSIQEISGVAMCCVVPLYSAPGVVECLLAYIREDNGFEYGEVVQVIKQQGVKKMPRWMMPAYFRPFPDEAVSGGESKKLNRKMLANMFTLQDLQAGQTAEDKPKNANAPWAGSEEGGKAGIRNVVSSVWAKTLNLNPANLDLEENFFDLGGHSTLAAKIAAELSGEYGISISVLDIYSHSSLGQLFEFLDPQGGDALALELPQRAHMQAQMRSDEGISVVGIAGRFPGADSTDVFWENLIRGTVSATFLSRELLLSKQVPEVTIADKEFVPVAYMIDGADTFDHNFFGINRHEASMMDPQHRTFVEATWAAMENAALPPRTGLTSTVVGVFAAAGIDGYLVHHLGGGPLKDTMNPQDIFLAEIGNEKDYIATRVAYLLDFTGPAMNVNSACSSALVAAVQGAAAIVASQCGAAIAGASSITFPNLGYRYQEGLVASVDGYVRPFDEAADGTVFGDSVAALVLRRANRQSPSPNLSWGTMRGFAVTNDGGQKAGYAAPSPVGQSRAIRAALEMMGDDPWTISYVECHCTGTRVGDGIETRGLIDAFTQLNKDSSGAQIALGSVKGNIAHANCAAGATGLIKALMMLRSKELVPTANFKNLNPKIDFKGTPFFVNSESCKWETSNLPLRAGVSSFGIGGTNAHIVMEEPDLTSLESSIFTSPLEFHLFPMSARTPHSLKMAATRLAEGLKREARTKTHHEPPTLAAAAYTMQSGRANLSLRKAVIVPVIHSDPLDTDTDDLPSAAAAVQGGMPALDELEELDEAVKRPSVAFVFPGQGSQYFGMARGLYNHVPLFRERIDQCCTLLRSPDLLGFDLRPLLFPNEEGTIDAEEEFAKPSVLQPALFMVEYALSEVFLALGVTPVAAAGHSLGEYAAAVIGGLLSLESALGIVAARAKSTETLAEDGAMLAVMGWSEDELSSISNGEHPGLWLAAVNSPVHAVISGELASINELQAKLKSEDRKCTKLHVRKAFHSGLIAKAADTLRGLGMPQESSNATTVPVASNHTGNWLSAAQLKGGSYWTDHMRGTVNWRQNVDRVLGQWKPTIILEVGPGNALSMLTAKCTPPDGNAPIIMQSMRHVKATNVHDVEALLSTVGRLWEVGYNINWDALHTTLIGASRPPHPLRLPSYSFEPTSLWVNPERSVYVMATEDPAPSDYVATVQENADDRTTQSRAPASTLVRFGTRTNSSEPAIKAYCLPFACGSATLFAPWAEQMDDFVEVVAVELPGRGARSNEKIPNSDFDDDVLLNEISSALLADLQGSQYVLVGFSMGGGICMELALRLAAAGAPAPLALYIAGRRPPAQDPSMVGEIAMTNEELAEYAFAPPEVATSAEFVEHVVPLLRADLGIDARTERRLSVANLAGQRLPEGVGLEVYCGTNDDIAPWSEAPGWQRFCHMHVGLHYFPGGHEFMKEHRPLLHSSWRQNALGRLVQQRSLELATLSMQGFAAPGASRISNSFPGSKSTKITDADLPLCAVRWVQAASSTAQTVTQGVVHIKLDNELPAQKLDEATAAMKAKTTVVVSCASTPGILSGKPYDVEVRQAWQFVRLVQHLLEEGAVGRLLLICPAAANCSAVAGASKAVAMEAGELRIQRVYVDPSCMDDAQNELAKLCGFADHYPEEVDLWIPDINVPEAVYAQRLEPMLEPSSRLQCVPKRSLDGSTATYVLTGATGGLGKALVGWLLRDQQLLPDQLVLVRRQGSVALTGDLAKCRTIEIPMVDDPDSTKVKFRDLRGVAGIFHLAGALDDGVLSGMTEDRMRKVAQPKCCMLVALLHAATAFNWSMHWVVGFSSTSSLFGYAGQTNYCAANALLDHLASFYGFGSGHLQDNSLPCRMITINWGPWAEAGMAKVGTKAYEQAVREGDTPLPTATALRCLGAALRTAGQLQPSTLQFCACDVDWDKSQWRELPILDLVSEGAAEARAAKAVDQSKEGKQSDGATVAQQVEAFLMQHAKNGSSWKRIQSKTLFQLGLDSLEVVQLRGLFNKKFGINAPLNIIADSSLKLSDLAKALCELIDQR